MPLSNVIKYDINTRQLVISRTAHCAEANHTDCTCASSPITLTLESPADEHDLMVIVSFLRQLPAQMTDDRLYETRLAEIRTERLLNARS